jgi:hypothetical protein
MQYQLPCGRVIYMSVEEYLSLSDQELRDIAFSGYNQEEPNYKSYASKQPRKVKNDDDHVEDYIDYTPETDEIEYNNPIDYDNLD